VTITSAEQAAKAQGRGVAAAGAFKAARAAGAGGAYFLKGPLDTVLALAGVLLLLPVCLVIALAIWLEDRGPVFVHQVRVGRRGVPFRVVKFRTMHVQRASRVHRQATADDSRITREIGRASGRERV